MRLGKIAVAVLAAGLLFGGGLCLYAAADAGCCGGTGACPMTGPAMGGLMKGKGMSQGDMTADRLAWMDKKLNLTDQQKAQLKPVLEEESAAMKAEMEKMKAIHQTAQTKMNGILTAEQQKKLADMQKKMQEKMKERMQERREKKTSGT